jgi:hypothetical protein
MNIHEPRETLEITPQLPKTGLIIKKKRDFVAHSDKSIYS